MINLEELIHDVQEAEEALLEAKIRRNDALEPVLLELGVPLTYQYISNVCFYDKNELSVTVGETYDRSIAGTYNFPLSIFEAEDPVAAAKKYNTKQQAIKDTAEKKTKLLKLKQLQKELGIK